MAYLGPIIFFLSGCFVLYVIIGYPLLLELVARRVSNPVNKNLELKPVTVLLAVHNGEQWIGDKLRSLLHLNYPRELMQILVISDGSTDRTEQLIEGFAGNGVELLRLPPGGKAVALNAGMARAHGEVLFFTDVRQPLHADCLRSLVACLGDPAVGAACGRLIFVDSGTRNEAHVGLYWRYEKWIRNNLTRIDSLLVGTGCVYAMRRDLAVPLPPDTLLDDCYLPLNAFFRGYRFVFDNDAIAYEYPTSLDTEFHRKLRTLAGLYQLIRSLPALLGPSNRMWLHFVSYKVGRLLLPFGLLAMAASCFWLPGIWASLAISAQGLFYGLALLDSWVPDSRRFKPLTSTPRTFVVLMAASLCAVSIFFVPPRTLWKETRVRSTPVS